MTAVGHGGSSMRLERRFTQAGKAPFEGMAFRAGDSEIRNPDGTIVFQQRGIEVPEAWSQVATDVLAQKYFRRAGVARRLKKVAEADMPECMLHSMPYVTLLDVLATNP